MRKKLWRAVSKQGAALLLEGWKKSVRHSLAAGPWPVWRNRTESLWEDMQIWSDWLHGSPVISQHQIHHAPIALHPVLLAVGL